MVVVPLTIKCANEVVAKWHRHNKPTPGGRFALGAMDGNRLVGVAIVGRPVARQLNFQEVAEINRLCVIDDAPKNTCSFLYGACRRVWFAMGGKKIITYTLQKESGSSLRAVGWQPTVLEKNNSTGWHSREREHQLVFDEAKIRWESVA